MSETSVLAMVLDFPNAPFRLAEIPLPVPAASEVLVRIHASAVNPLDTKIRAGAGEHAQRPLPNMRSIRCRGFSASIWQAWLKRSARGSGVSNLRCSVRHDRRGRWGSGLACRICRGRCGSAVD